jgi:hypothetical protein
MKPLAMHRPALDYHINGALESSLSVRVQLDF